jgi:excisionase family DNA binding protein
VSQTLPEERIVLTVPEAARVLGIGRDQAYRACRRGDLPTIRIGRRILVSRVSLEQFLTVPHVAMDRRAYQSRRNCDDRVA